MPGVIPKKQGNWQPPLFASKSINLARASLTARVGMAFIVAEGTGVNVSDGVGVDRMMLVGTIRVDVDVDKEVVTTEVGRTVAVAIPQPLAISMARIHPNQKRTENDLNLFIG